MNVTGRKILKRIAFALVLAVLAEVFIFNYRFWFSLGNSEVTLSDYESGGTLISFKGNYYVKADNTGYIEISGINDHIKNLHLDLEIVGGSDYNTESVYNTKYDVVDVDIYADDKGNSEPFLLGSRSILHKITQSQYMTVHLAGNTDTVRINLKASKGTIIAVNSISYNAIVPMTFSVARLLVVVGIMMVFSIIRPSSKAYNYVYNVKSKRQLAVKAGTIVALSLFFFWLCSANPYFTHPRWQHHYQYQDLAKAWSEGSLSLTDEPSSELLAMDNPYDTNLRDSENISFRWDSSFYNGKYYVYYGVLPEILFYFPWYIVTHQDFSTYIGIFILGVVLIAGMFHLLSSVVQRWFKNTSFLLYLMTAVTSCIGCGVLLGMIRPDFYTMPLLMAVDLSIWGLSFWVKSVTRDETGKRHLKARWLFVGSLLMALVSASRPQLLVMSFVAIPLFWNNVFRDRELLYGKWKNTLGLVMPYVVVAAAVMVYNYARFGSPFDYGANYNLTTNDMTVRGFQMGRTFLGLFYFLFQVPEIDGTWPFWNVSVVSTTYLGTTIYENMCGGLIACNLWLWPLFAVVLKAKGIWKDRRCLLFLRGCLVMGIIIIIADTQMAGILPRYIMDFGWIFFLVAAAVMYTLEEWIRDKNYHTLRRAFRYFMMVAFAQAIIYNFFRIFITDSESVMEGNPAFYYGIMHLMAFWL
jgi:hypothetical protein